MWYMRTFLQCGMSETRRSERVIEFTLWYRTGRLKSFDALLYKLQVEVETDVMCRKADEVEHAKCFVSSWLSIIRCHAHGVQRRRTHVDIQTLSSSVTPVSSLYPSPSFRQRLRIFLYDRSVPSTTYSWYHQSHRHHTHTVPFLVQNFLLWFSSIWRSPDPGVQGDFEKPNGE